MKCPQCQAEGKRSRVIVGTSSTTCMGVQTFYDEDGFFHNHDPNVTSTRCCCTEGHEWVNEARSECIGCKRAVAPTAATPDGSKPENHTRTASDAECPSAASREAQ